MKTITLSDFTQQDSEFLADLIDTYLKDQDIEAESFAFNIEVDYEEMGGSKEIKLSLSDNLNVKAVVGGG